MKKSRRKNRHLKHKRYTKYKLGKTKKENLTKKVFRPLLKLAFIFILIILYFSIFVFQITKEENYYYIKRNKFIKSKGKTYNESNLITLEDKINWLIIHDTNKLKAKCADKILLHEYSKKKLGKDICNKIIKIYNKTDEIKLNELPEQFVLKANHGSGFNIIVENKKEMNFNYAKYMLNYWMSRDFGRQLKEFHYSFIKRKIFSEEYIGKNLKNYKFLCYNGQPKYVYISVYIEGYKYRNFYDMNWKFLNFSCLSKPHPTYIFERSKFFELMKEYSKKLSSDFKFVRVDLYELENEVRLGELTFTPMSGAFYCKNLNDEIELGKDIDTKIRIYDYFIKFLSFIGYYDNS